VKNKIKEWLRRYLLAEILSTVLSLATAWIIHRTTGDNVIAAFGGSAMASISFYGIIAYSDVRKSLKHHKKHDLSYGLVAYFKDLRNLVIEFGPSEILDVLAKDDCRCSLFHSRHRDVRGQEKTFVGIHGFKGSVVY